MITVLLSVFNGEKWLDKSIKSILNQSYKDFEFLIINDGSTDKSSEIIKSYAKKDKRIKYLFHENIGLTKSLNKGLKLANREWIARIDCDDMANYKRLELQLNFVISNNLGLAGSYAKIIDEEGNIKRDGIVPTSHEEIFKNMKNLKKSFCHSSAFFNKNLAISVGGYREIMKRSQDYDLWLRILEKSKVGCINYFGAYLREHESRVTGFDSGAEQNLYAYAAKVSYLIRRDYGINSDPLNDNSLKKNDYFIKFLKKNLKAKGITNFHKILFEYKKNSSQNNLMKKIILFFLYFDKVDLLLRILYWQFKGDFASKDLTLNWVSHTKDEMFEILNLNIEEYFKK